MEKSLLEATMDALSDINLKESVDTVQNYGIDVTNEDEYIFGGEGEEAIMANLDGAKKYFNDFADYIAHYKADAINSYNFEQADVEAMKNISAKIEEAINLFHTWEKKYL